MQNSTTVARKLSKIMGLDNESTSSYTSVDWNPDLEYHHDTFSQSTNMEGNFQSLDANIASQNNIGSSIMGKKLSSFLGMTPNASEDADGNDEETDRLPTPSKELISQMKKKMSMFFTTTTTYASPEDSTTAAESSNTTHKGIDFPILRRVERRHQRPKQGAIKPATTSRKRGPIQSQHQVHMLSTLQLISITFFAVSGGPYGFEPTVGAGGPGLMLVGLLLAPIIWAAPLAYMTAELSCMMPESGGHVLWVYRAFGPFWSFVNSCFAFACSILDNAMYPVLFVEYLSALIYEEQNRMSYGWSVFIKISIVFIVTVINILGINIVGIVSVILGIMVLAPFITMCLIGLTHLNFDWMGLDGDDGSPSTYTQSSPPVDWGKFLTLLLWNTSGFDAAGTCAAEVRNPGHAFPKALSVSVALMVGVYALPTIIGVSVLPDYRLWKEGTYIIVAKLIGGNILKGWMGFSATSSAFGLLLTRLCTNSRIVYGMALVEQVINSTPSISSESTISYHLVEVIKLKDLVPPVFSKLHPVYATPWMAILATSLCTLLMTGFNFYSLAEADMLFYAFSTILKFASLVQLRYTEPDAFRPYKIPLGDGVLAAAVVFPIGSCITMLAFSSERAHGIGIVGASFAIFLYIIKELYNQYGTQAEEAVQHRMTRVQQNLDSMQKRIDKVIEEEFTVPVKNLGGTLGDAIPQLPQQIVSGVSGLSGPVKSLGRGLGYALGQSSQRIDSHTRAS